MGRKNNRDRRWIGEPIDLTPPDIVEQQDAAKAHRAATLNDWELRRFQEREAAERRRRQADARINNGIDWSVCLVPGCGGKLTLHARATYAPNQRDHRTRLPLCWEHLAVAHAEAVWYKTDELMIAAAAQVIDRKRTEMETLDAAAKKAWLAKSDGHMYYVRLNGLIKVGWTRDLNDRLRAYGPGVEILCHYPATRQDETNLHRQLRPFLAKGREWYQDCQALADFVTKAIEQHGQPTVQARWTEPKEQIRPRKRSA